MRKSTIIVFGIGVLSVVLLAGCVTGGGASDEELVAGVMAAWKAGLEAQDVDAFMACYSENYATAEVPSKEAMREFIEMGVEQGFLEDIAVDIDGAMTTIDGDTAMVSPVEVEGVMGAMSLDFTLTKEEGVWAITSSEN